MDTKNYKERFLRIISIFCISIILVLGYDKVGAILGIILSAFIPFIIGGIFALILNIPVRFFENHFLKFKNKFLNKIKRPISIILSLLILITLVSGIGILVGPKLASAVSDMSHSVPSALSSLITTIENNIVFKPETLNNLEELKAATSSWGTLLNYCSSLIPDISKQMVSAVTVVKNIAGSVVNIVVAFIFCIYVLSRKEEVGLFFKKCCYTFFKPNHRNSLFHAFHVLQKSFENFIHGQCLESFLVALIFSITASIFQFKSALIIGIAMFFLAFIPFVGNFLACGLGVLLTFAMESPLRAFGIAVLFCVIQILDGYFLYPRVIGMKVKMPPLLIFVSSLAGGKLFGVFGMILSIPVVTAIYTLVNEKFKEKGVTGEIVNGEIIVKQNNQE